MKLNAAHMEALNELASLDGDGWIKTRFLSGTAAARSSRNLKALADGGLVESKRWGDNRQSQYIWRITDAGRLALTSHHCNTTGE